MIQLENLTTESRNNASAFIDQTTTIELVHLMNEEDKKVPQAIESILPQIAASIDLISNRLQKGGRLFYIGAGTSGRLGILDASECPPTYGIEPELIQGIIAGGPAAVFKSQEGAEDSPELAAHDLKEKKLQSLDTVVGLAASGRTPYVLGGLNFAKSIGAATIAITCNQNSPIAEIADIALTAVVGPELITGSTRMKAGTAQKLILNMLSTGCMIRLGKVYGNLMVDVKSSNLKLEERARHIVMEATGVTRQESIACLAQTNGQVKLAIFMILSSLDLDAATKILDEHQGFIHKALQSLQ
ncbi:N-acetylmuramic acid 6-phosphate etherase [Propionispira arboris]|uniref:N-acetylmuramic acid 6-phosphate etherase n=1 Tax=Propionispira arboris TaxID=84035 RepID=A0A1H6WYJ6_9FIRM|nr:N-acetylmuramic acid 6-phosphate etherase [Propionispira arboris]SEJ21991.1 N-acetylmuramic acid 6-phosphate etherase [Propionispira arboris]